MYTLALRIQRFVNSWMLLFCVIQGQLRVVGRENREPLSPTVGRGNRDPLSPTVPSLLRDKAEQLGLSASSLIAALGAESSAEEKGIYLESK